MAILLGIIFSVEIITIINRGAERDKPRSLRCMFHRDLYCFCINELHCRSGCAVQPDDARLEIKPNRPAAKAYLVDDCDFFISKFLRRSGCAVQPDDSNCGSLC